MAAGARGSSGAVVWNGTKWRVMTSPPQHVITASSCASSSMCAVVNGVGRNKSGPIAETWNGNAWKSWTDTAFCDHQPSDCGDRDVSCASPTRCAAVGDTATVSGDTLPGAAVWDGADWHISNPPAATSVTSPHAVSCTGTFCLTIGNDIRAQAYVASYQATSGTWRDISASARLPWPADKCGGACFLPGTLSCATSTACMTDGLAGFFAWNGHQFKAAHPKSAGSGSKLSGISCAKGFCMAVGYRTVNRVRVPLSELWNGKTWKILRQA